MGSIYAGLFAEAGHEVWAVDLWQDHVDAINRDGLRLEGASGDRRIRSLRASTDPTAATGSDLIVIATKASGVAGAAEKIAPCLGDQTMVLTIQNGLGADERILRYLPATNVFLGVADGFGAAVKAPGHVQHAAMNLIRLGELNGGLTNRLVALADVWEAAGFTVKAFDDIHQLVWEKLVVNVTLSAPCTVFDCTLGELMANPTWWAIALGCAMEVFRLGQAQEIAFGFEDPIAYVTEFASRMPEARPSMLLDHQAGRTSEIDVINGMAAELGAKLGIPTPYNDVLSAVVRRREAQFN